MGKKLLKRQLVKGLLCIFTIISLVFGTIIFFFERARYRQSLTSIEISLNAVVSQNTGVIGNQVFFQNREGLQHTVQRLKEFHGILEVEIFDNRGDSIFPDYQDTPPTYLEEQDRNAGTYALKRTSFDGIPVIRYVAPLTVVGDRYGFIAVYYDLRELFRQVRLSALLFSGLLISLFSSSVLILSRLLRVLVMDPLSSLSAVMQRVSEGELGVQAHIRANNELEQIAHVFNTMSSENAEMYTKLQELNRSLGDTIALRTRELHTSRSLLESVLNSSQDGIMVLKTITDESETVIDFEWLLANPAATGLFISEVGSLVGQRITARIPDIAQEELFAGFRHVASSGEPLNKELYCELKHMRGWYHVSAVVIDEGIAVTFRNITRRKLMEIDLQKRVNQDGLTEISNRHYFDQCLDQEWHVCMVESQPMVLIFIDVDFFKAYNDTYGHLLGDECLKQIGAILTEVTSRPRDLAARYGGEEFVVLLPRTDTGGGINVVEKIRELLVDRAILHLSSTVSEVVTVSMGVVICKPTDDLSVREFMRTADTALYTSKMKGRDRYTVVEYR